LALLIIIQMVFGGEPGETVAAIFARLYEQYLPKVYRFIRFRIDDNDTAEDLTSTVFEKALTRFHSYQSQRASFSTWVFVIARNTVIDHFRVSHKDRMVEIDEDGPGHAGGPSPEEQAIREEEFGRLQTCLKRLPPAQQSVISLKFGAHMTNREIARATGMSESQVGNIVFRAVRKLRDDFKGWRDED
jgi:RNA polymerase sigma factor (sigma-70 family)